MSCARQNIPDDAVTLTLDITENLTLKSDVKAAARTTGAVTGRFDGGAWLRRSDLVRCSSTKLSFGT